MKGIERERDGEREREVKAGQLQDEKRKWVVEHKREKKE